MTKSVNQSAFWTRMGHNIFCIDAGYLGPGNACFYLLEDAGEVAVVETGTSHSVHRLLELLEELGIAHEQVRYVVPTHVHLDHAGGAGHLIKLFQQATLIMHPRGARHMADPGRLIESSIAVYGKTHYHALYGDVQPIPSVRIREAGDGDTLMLGNRELLIRHTPGHADHHLCLWDNLSKGWFSGDVFGVSYRSMRLDNDTLILPTTTPTQFRPAELIKSVRLLEQYEPERLFLTHFGELAFSPELADDLVDQVSMYRDIANACADRDSRKDRIKEKLTALLLTKLASLNVPQEPLLHKLAGDLELNAQGLEAWLQRLEKKSRLQT